MLPVESPFKTYTGLDGKPLDNGYVYFGEPGQDPIAHPVTVYWDPDGTLPAAQPLRTVNGYIVNAGTPANVFSAGTYSQLVKDSKGRQVFYSATSDDFSFAPAFTAFMNEVAGPEGAASIGRGSGTVESALDSLEDAVALVPSKLPSDRLARPAFIEQHISGFFGRGMLTAESLNITTEQGLSGAFATGADTLAVTDAANFLVGGCVTVKHDNGLYSTYFVDSKSGNNIGIRPALRNDCLTASARIERTWYNRAHPGKFYIRSLAQRIARGTELEAAMPNGGRVLYTNLSSNPNSFEDTLTPIGGAAVYYYDADNLGETGNTSTPVRFTFGRSAYVENILANTAGIETPYFDVNGVASAIAKVAFSAKSNTIFSIQVFDEADIERGKLIIQPNDGVLQIYTLPVNLRGANRIKVRVAAEYYSAPGGYFTLAQIDVFEAPALASKIISNPTAKIVCLGDSWVQGDLASTPQREPLTTQLALELPYATIINAGVGGNKIWQELERFDADVAAHKPDYVVINTGTNECYSPSSGVFYPNAVTEFLQYYNRLLNKIAEIGARPIIIGVPALAQYDEEVPGFAQWLLNDRARTYARYVFEWQSAKPYVSSGSGASGSWTKFADGTLIARHTISITTSAANTLASASWTFPVPFVAAPHVVASPANYNSNQVLSAGVDLPTTTNVGVRGVSSVAAATFNVNCTATGRWR
ncbi:SGNH/GDSL hydrolase family protein [Massilia sp. ZL223]|uniref:SGNH/GDSL hydrolase family protein n=1 Tax=Massilia sp. ZL223 TaxID=2824904 RepID=UPI001B838CBC|nr:SGNH/GDSL hydrolase family protein [Massilia sp. ZL223]MBQ5963138.1 hypothetical protein [Massilia sp. ZL223]